MTPLAALEELPDSASPSGKGAPLAPRGAASLPDPTLRLYAVVRVDLGMTPGKIASQAGHAFLGAFLKCRDEARLAEYHKDYPQSPGTKVCLQARNLDQLLRAEQAAREAGPSIFRVVDSGCENFFGGQPLITAIGFGPATREEIKHITKKLKLL